MNRIEEIKLRLPKRYPQFTSHADASSWAFENAEFIVKAPFDIEHLLSKLEIAEKGLERVAEVDVKDFDVLAKFIHAGATKALQQIRS